MTRMRIEQSVHKLYIDLLKYPWTVQSCKIQHNIVYINLSDWDFYVLGLPDEA